MLIKIPVDRGRGMGATVISTIIAFFTTGKLLAKGSMLLV